jgi:ParB-like chromosome segregation protein Spo0J
MNLSISYKLTQDLFPYAMNSRTHSDEQVAQIAASIMEFGFTNPILVDEKNSIIAGHGRLLAAKRLKLPEVPTIELNAGWDNEALFTELKRLQEFDFNLDLLGFETDELSLLLNEVDFEPASEADQGQLDELDPKWVTCPHCDSQFDLREVE